MNTDERSEMQVFKMEWMERAPNQEPRRMIAEVCELHATLIMQAHPESTGAGRYEAPSCEFCERELVSA